MRLQVEIAAASWMPVGRGQLAQGADGAALGQREPLAQVERRRLVGDAEGEQLRHQALTSLALLLLAFALLGEARQLAQLALDPLQFRRHDRGGSPSPRGGRSACSAS